MTELKTGTRLDGFELIEKIASGGMGSLWRASKAGIDYPLALKVPFLDAGQDVSTVVGYEIEEMIMKRLSGPHVPRFAGSGDLARTPFIAMEFVQGKPLADEMAMLPVTPAKVVETGKLIATALASLNSQLVSHLDLKPDNIFLTNRGAVLIDFGLARHAELPDLLAQESSVPMGTPAYISPEQVLGDRTSPNSDIFSLGCILYEMATGQKPFGEPTGKAGMERRLYQKPRPPRMQNPAVPRWLQEIILKCLEVDPARRYLGAGNLLSDLNHPEQVHLTERGNQDSETGMLARLVNRFIRKPDLASRIRAGTGASLSGSSVILAAIDVTDGVDLLAEEVRAEVARLLHSRKNAKLACMTVLKTKLVGEDELEDRAGRSVYINRLVELKHWAEPLGLGDEQVSFHVIEAFDVANAILNYAANNDVGHIAIGARASSALRRHLGSVSAQVVAEALCSVSVVRVKRIEAQAAGLAEG
jgi:eukaryotic-like serine/threonine-protein kinase